MIDIAAIRPAALPWDDDDGQIAWLLLVGAVWWQCFASLGEDAA
jgi:hypothetical protein